MTNENLNLQTIPCDLKLTSFKSVRLIPTTFFEMEIKHGANFLIEKNAVDPVSGL